MSSPLITFLALCQADEPAEIRVATCQLLVPQNASTPPEWVELIPAGEHLDALDGRKFWNKNPSLVVERFNQHPVDLPLDYEHGSETKARNGDEAPAAGWIKELRLKNGAIEGRIEYTPRGSQAVCSKEYRYISPAFRWNRETGEIISLSSAGLTTHPALVVKALSRSQETAQTVLASGSTKEKTSMDPELKKALGLKEDASDAEVMKAAKAMCTAYASLKEKHEALEGKHDEMKEKMEKAKASSEAEVATLRAQASDPTKLVPRADYDLALSRAEKAEAEIAKASKDAFVARVSAVVEGGVKAGKIAPASREHYLAMCNDQSHLELVEKMLGVAPNLVADSTKFEGKPGDAPAPINALQKQMCAQLGISEEELRASQARMRQQRGEDDAYARNY